MHRCTVSHHSIIASGYNLAHVTWSVQKKSKTIATEYLMHLALIGAATGPSLKVGTHTAHNI